MKDKDKFMEKWNPENILKEVRLTSPNTIRADLFQEFEISCKLPDIKKFAIIIEDGKRILIGVCEYNKPKTHALSVNWSTVPSFNTFPNNILPIIQKFVLYDMKESCLSNRTLTILVGVCKDSDKENKIRCRFGEHMEKIMYFPKDTIFTEATAEDLLELDYIAIDDKLSFEDNLLEAVANEMKEAIDYQIKESLINTVSPEGLKNILDITGYKE